jgi:hypothetical protein
LILDVHRPHQRGKKRHERGRWDERGQLDEGGRRDERGLPEIAVHRGGAWVGRVASLDAAHVHQRPRRPTGAELRRGAVRAD